MMSVDDAVAIIAARVRAVQEIETVSLAEADGRVLAAEISAPLPLPPFTNSAVDGYAVRSADLSITSQNAFPVRGRIQAGALPREALEPGVAVRIFTGAPMPQGADIVFMQEDVRIDDAGNVVLPPGLKRGANVRPIGEDVAAGHPALAAGQRLRPQDIALCAAFGLTELQVRRRVARRRVFDGRRTGVARARHAPVRNCSIRNRFMLIAHVAPARMRRQRSRHSQGRTQLACCRR